MPPATWKFRLCSRATAPCCACRRLCWTRRAPRWLQTQALAARSFDLELRIAYAAGGEHPRRGIRHPGGSPSRLGPLRAGHVRRRRHGPCRPLHEGPGHRAVLPRGGGQHRSRAATSTDWSAAGRTFPAATAKPSASWSRCSSRIPEAANRLYRELIAKVREIYGADDGLPPGAGRRTSPSTLRAAASSRNEVGVQRGGARRVGQVALPA